MSQEHSHDAVTEEDRLVARRTLELASECFSTLRCLEGDSEGQPRTLLSILQRGKDDQDDIARWRTWNDITALLAYSAPKDQHLDDMGLLNFLGTLARVSAFGCTEWAADSAPADDSATDAGAEVPHTDMMVQNQLDPVLAEHFPRVPSSNERSSTSQPSPYLPRSMLDPSGLSGAPQPVSAISRSAQRLMTRGGQRAEGALAKRTDRNSSSAADFQPPAGHFNRSHFHFALTRVWVYTAAAQICDGYNTNPTAEQIRSVVAGGPIPSLWEMGLSL